MSVGDIMRKDKNEKMEELLKQAYAAGYKDTMHKVAHLLEGEEETAEEEAVEKAIGEAVEEGAGEDAETAEIDQAISEILADPASATPEEVAALVDAASKLEDAEKEAGVKTASVTDCILSLAMIGASTQKDQ